MKGWIGVDLDGTLAFYDEWRGASHIGEPIKPMVDRVKQWRKNGRDVRIVTARVHPENPGREEALVAIEKWTKEVFGEKLLAQCDKDFAMDVLWDDRCVQVEMNTGHLVIERTALNEKFNIDRRNPRGLLNICELLMMHKRGSLEGLSIDEFLKLQGQLLQKVSGWGGSKDEDKEYDDKVKALCEYVINNVRW